MIALLHMSFGIFWAIISLTALILMPWTLSFLVWFFFRKFAQPAYFTASAIVLCALQSRTLLFRTVRIFFKTRLYRIMM